MTSGSGMESISIRAVILTYFLSDKSPPTDRVARLSQADTHCTRRVVVALPHAVGEGGAWLASDHRRATSWRGGMCMAHARDSLGWWRRGSWSLHIPRGGLGCGFPPSSDNSNNSNNDSNTHQRQGMSAGRRPACDLRPFCLLAMTTPEFLVP